MAIQQEGIATAHVVPNPQNTGIAFVNNYYKVLVYSPQLLYKFYKDCSILSRPGPNGLILTGTAVISESQIMSAAYSGVKVEIKTVDSQASYNNGVLVLVGGSITFKTNERRTFSQSFLLVPQENGHFVLNDIFMWVGEESEQLKTSLFFINGCIVEDFAANADLLSKRVVKSEPVAETQALALNGLIEHSTIVVDEHAPAAEKVHMQKREVPQGSPGQNVAAIEHVGNEGPPTHVQETPIVLQDVPEKSYALIVKQNAAPPTVALQKPFLKRVVPSASQSLATNPTTPRKVSYASSIPVNMTDNNTPEGNGSSIFISNLPMNVTTSQVVEELKKFGVIKPSGVHVKSRQGGGSSYAFVEFEETASVQSALEASPILIGGHQAFIREKRPYRERLKNDGARGRGRSSYGGRGNGRSDFVNNKGRGSSLSGGRVGGVYERRNGGRGEIITNNRSNPRI